MLLHGVTATRRYVVHGSKALPRRGYRLISYDARGHGESEPAPEGEGYDYPALSGGPRAGHRRALRPRRPSSRATRWAATRPPPSRWQHRSGSRRSVLIGPGVARHAGAGGGALAHWDRLADGLERGGVEGFMERLRGRPGGRARLGRAGAANHARANGAAPPPRGDGARAPRGRALGSLRRARGSSSRSTCPALVVASHDEADPGHPYAVAEAWAEACRGPSWSARSPARRRWPGRGASSLARDRRVLRAAGVGVSPAGPSSRITSRRPDQVSSIAQTLLSTRRFSSASSRTTSSVRSVSTPRSPWARRSRARRRDPAPASAPAGAAPARRGCG